MLSRLGTLGALSHSGLLSPLHAHHHGNHWTCTVQIESGKLTHRAIIIVILHHLYLELH